MGLFGTKRLKIGVKAREGRGKAEASTVIDACHSNFRMIQDTLKEQLSDDERGTATDYFNELIEGEDDLGDILFGDDCEADAFKNRLELLTAAQQKTFTDALIDQEIIDGDEFTD